MDALTIAKVLGSVALKNSDAGKIAVDVFNRVIDDKKEDPKKKLSYEMTGNDLATAINGLPQETQKLFLDHQFNIQQQKLENEAAAVQARKDTKIEMEKSDRAGGPRPKIAMILVGVLVGLVVVVSVMYLTSSETGMKPEDVEGLNAIIEHILGILQAFFSA